MNHSLERNIELTKLYSCSEVDAAEFLNWEKLQKTIQAIMILFWQET
jgi:hypothetical protein